MNSSTLLHSSADHDPLHALLRINLGTSTQPSPSPPSTTTSESLSPLFALALSASNLQRNEDYSSGYDVAPNSVMEFESDSDSDNDDDDSAADQSGLAKESESTTCSSDICNEIGDDDDDDEDDDDDDMYSMDEHFIGDVVEEETALPVKEKENPQEAIDAFGGEGAIEEQTTMSGDKEERFHEDMKAVCRVIVDAETVVSIVDDNSVPETKTNEQGMDNTEDTDGMDDDARDTNLQQVSDEVMNNIAVDDTASDSISVVHSIDDPITIDIIDTLDELAASAGEATSTNSQSDDEESFSAESYDDEEWWKTTEDESDDESMADSENHLQKGETPELDSQQLGEILIKQDECVPSETCVEPESFTEDQSHKDCFNDSRFENENKEQVVQENDAGIQQLLDDFSTPAGTPCVDNDTSEDKVEDAICSDKDGDSIKESSTNLPEKVPVVQQSRHVVSESPGDQDNEDYSYTEWEKPSWVKQSVLRKTQVGEVVKHGKSLARPITNINANKDESRDTNKIANPNILAKSKAGEDVRVGCSLASPVTMIREKANRQNSYAEGTSLAWEKPSWATKTNILKPTQYGSLARQGENLALPVTNISILAKEKESEKIGWTKPSWATGEIKLKSVAADKKVPSWTKPDWTKSPGLKSTPIGEKMVKRLTLEYPITFPHGKRY